MQQFSNAAMQQFSNSTINYYLAAIMNPSPTR
jgi:hypothetical protein